MRMQPGAQDPSLPEPDQANLLQTVPGESPNTHASKTERSENFIEDIEENNNAEDNIKVPISQDSGIETIENPYSRAGKRRMMRPPTQSGLPPNDAHMQSVGSQQ